MKNKAAFVILIILALIIIPFLHKFTICILSLRHKKTGFYRFLEYLAKYYVFMKIIYVIYFPEVNGGHFKSNH